jgi:hypothetical protein
MIERLSRAWRMMRVATETKLEMTPKVDEF